MPKQKGSKEYKESEEHKDGLRLVIALSIVVGVGLLGQLAIGITETVGKTLLPIIYFRTGISILFWSSFIIMAISIYKFTKLSRYFKGSKNVHAVASLGMVIAIAQLGQFGVTSIKFFKNAPGVNLLIPPIVRNNILYAIFLIGFAYVLYAIYVYKKV